MIAVLVEGVCERPTNETVLLIMDVEVSWSMMRSISWLCNCSRSLCCLSFGRVAQYRSLARTVRKFTCSRAHTFIVTPGFGIGLARCIANIQQHQRYSSRTGGAHIQKSHMLMCAHIHSYGWIWNVPRQMYCKHAEARTVFVTHGVST